MILIPLKLKHRNPNKKVLHRNWDPKPEGTATFSGGRFGSKNNNSGKLGKQTVQGIGPRRRAYNTHYTP